MVKFQLKKVLCLNVAVGHCAMTEQQLVDNMKVCSGPTLAPTITLNHNPNPHPTLSHTLTLTLTQLSPLSLTLTQTQLSPSPCPSPARDQLPRLASQEELA